MKESPLLFSTPMVQAILDGRKTQTRRIIKLPPPSGTFPANWNYSPYRIPAKGHELEHRFTDGIGNLVSIPESKLPNGKPGDLLWVKETWTKTMVQDEEGWFFIYKADGDEWAKPWTSSRFMPKAAARIWLQIEEIRVERLQDITEEDAIAEGIKPLSFTVGKPHAVLFFQLWDMINGPGSSDQNPWLWVIKFRVLSTTGKPKTFCLLYDESSLTTCKKDVKCESCEYSRISTV